MRSAIALLAMLALAACGEGGGEIARPARAAPAPPIPVPGSVSGPKAPVSADGVRGQSARALIAQFGSPKIDMQEGPARKLQFMGSACVMDVFLYPPSKGREAVAKHLDTRLHDGRPADPASCVATLRRVP